MSAPREWWINNLGADDSIDGPMVESMERVHVIEFTAYQAAIARAEKAESCEDKLANKLSKVTAERDDLLKAQAVRCDEMRKLRTHIDKLESCARYDG